MYLFMHGCELGTCLYDEFLFAPVDDSQLGLHNCGEVLVNSVVLCSIRTHHTAI